MKWLKLMLNEHFK